jgi:hypothetical protein
MTKRTRKNIPKGFDSWLEFDLSKELRQCKFHTEKIPYVQRKTYEPDFIFYDEEEELLTYIEVKGRFRDRAEAKKYVGSGQIRTVSLITPHKVYQTSGDLKDD